MMIRQCSRLTYILNRQPAEELRPREAAGVKNILSK